MASIGHNETAAVEAFDDDAATAVEKHAPGHVQLPLAPGSHPHNPASHDPDRPDISFPFQTTNTVEGGFTDEYRVTSKTGYITADLALRPVPSRYHKLPAVLADPEKAFRLKQVKLVTWYENDPEDPRNWKNAYKWCEYPLHLSLAVGQSLTCLRRRYHVRLRTLGRGDCFRHGHYCR